MIVDFVTQKEIDLPEAPKGYSWRGAALGFADVITLATGHILHGFGHIAIYPDFVSATAFDLSVTQTELGKFATPRAAAEALFAALGLEVQP